MFEKILVPIDGSALSYKAVEMAQSLVEDGKGKEITLIHVTNDVQELMEKTHGFAERILDEGLKKMSANIKADVRLEVGPPAEVIADVARHGRYDLVVMGTRGLSPITNVLIGSVSAKVAATAPCPVLLVK